MSGAKRVAIVGAAGKVGSRLVPLLVERGVEVVALARRDDQLAALEWAGAQPRHLDIEKQDADAFATVFAGCDAVVFTAGGGPDGNAHRKQTVDLEGSLKSIAGARTAGIARFVQVSAISVDEKPDASRGPVWEAYVEAKSKADAELRDSGLDWTILRPGGLTDEEGTGLVSLGERVDRATVPRADVAAVLAEVLARPNTVGHQWSLVSGDVPIAEAVTAALG